MIYKLSKFDQRTTHLASGRQAISRRTDRQVAFSVSVDHFLVFGLCKIGIQKLTVEQ